MKNLLVIYLFFTATCMAENLVPITLEEVRTHAIAHSPKVRQINARFSKQAAEALSVDKLHNPALNATLGIPTSNRENLENPYDISVGLPIRPSDFGDRKNLSRLIKSLSSLEKQIELQNFITEVSILYYSLWSLQIQENQLKDQLNQAKKISVLLSDLQPSEDLVRHKRKLPRQPVLKLKLNCSDCSIQDLKLSHSLCASLICQQKIYSL